MQTDLRGQGAQQTIEQSYPVVVDALQAHAGTGGLPFARAGRTGAQAALLVGRRCGAA